MLSSEDSGLDSSETSSTEYWVSSVSELVLSSVLLFSSEDCCTELSGSDVSLVPLQAQSIAVLSARAAIIAIDFLIEIFIECHFSFLFLICSVESYVV